MTPMVSVMVPCRNEAAFIERCLGSVLASDYPREQMEVIVADGMSDDGTRERIGRYASLDSRVRCIDNPRRTTPAALNRGIRAARGEVIVRLDGHAAIAPDYIARAVKHLESTGADCVGGRMRTLVSGPGMFAAAIGIALAHPFGVGSAYFRIARESQPPRFVDTVFGACWKKEIFDRLGGFDERLERSQDIEFSARLRRAGGKILLAPDMRIDYYAPRTLGRFLRQSWINGMWAILPCASSGGMPVRWRHLAPLAFVLGLAASVAASPWIGRWALAAMASYAAANLAASIAAAWKHRRPCFAFLLPLVFAGLHLAYGAGSAWACARLAIGPELAVRRARGGTGNGGNRVSPALAPSYADVTERPGQKASAMQLEMLASRYAWAAAQAISRDVLEVACGAGMGLPRLAEVARSVQAGDMDPENLALAGRACAGCGNVALGELHAPDLPFPDDSFDVVLLFEAIYYLRDAADFFEQARRVLRRGGTLLVVTVNPEWRGFNPSSLATRYWRARELRNELEAAGFQARVQGAFPEIPGWSQSAVGAVRRAAVALGLVPRSMQGKAVLKRIFYGPLENIPARLHPARPAPLHDLDPADPGRCRVLYATAQKVLP